MIRRTGVAALLAAALATVLPARAQEQEANVLRAGALARGGRCDQALALLASSGATSARAALLRGQCHVAGKRWAQAVAALDEALRSDPTLDDAKLPLLIARYHVGDLEGARQALDDLPASAPQRPEYHLYRGLLLLESAESAAAGAAFERARALAPTEMDPVASYFSGVAWLSAKDRARADAAFDRVIALAPDSEWAERAREARAGGQRGPLARWAWLRAGAEWDSNVLLRGDGVDLPAAIGDESDGRGVWVAHGGAELLRRGDWSGGVTGTYYGSAHFDLTDFDEHHPTLGSWLDYRIDEATVLRLRADAGYAWIDGDDFLFDVAFGPMLYREWGAAGRSELSLRASHLDFRYPVSTQAGFPSDYRDRDGWGWALNAQHTLRLGAPSADLTLGVTYYGYAAEGGEYDYDGADVFAGVESLLPLGLVGRALLGASYLPFARGSSYEDPPGVSGSFESDDREDFAWRARLELEREVGAGFSALARYRYQDRASNVDVFEYDRHVIGLYLTYTFAP
jgi:tetratricopeptide (TPR) repeat protein